MADVSISIRQTNGSIISVSGHVEDVLLSPFTSQLAVLLSTAAHVSA